MTEATKKKRIVRGASACVFDAEGRVLFIRREKEPFRGTFAFPGGSIEEGETPLDAAKRELREETGHVVPAEPFASTTVVLENDDHVFTITSFAFEGSTLEAAGELATHWLAPAEAKHAGLTAGVDRALERFVLERAKKQLPQ